MKSHTLNELAIASRRARFDKGPNAIDKAIHAQADIGGKTFVITQLLKALSEQQKTRVLAEINATMQRRSKRKASSSAARVEDLVKLFVNAQRDVLRQALTTINANHHWHTEYDDFDGYGTKSQLHTQNIAAITAIQEQLA